jgi:hypothetical protein
VKLSKVGLIFSGIYFVFFLAVFSVGFLYNDSRADASFLVALFPAMILLLCVNAVAPSFLNFLTDVRCETSLCEHSMMYGVTVVELLISLLIAYLTGWAMQGFYLLTCTALGLQRPTVPASDGGPPNSTRR